MFIIIAAIILVLFIFLSVFTIIGILTILSDEANRNVIISIRREYGFLSPYRMAAVFCVKKYPTLGYRIWYPIGSTLMYGFAGSILQLFLVKTDDDKRIKKLALFNKLINNDNGYDR